jgi:hypothetical protein
MLPDSGFNQYFSFTQINQQAPHDQFYDVVFVCRVNLIPHRFRDDAKQRTTVATEYSGIYRMDLHLLCFYEFNIKYRKQLNSVF